MNKLIKTYTYCFTTQTQRLFDGGYRSWHLKEWIDYEQTWLESFEGGWDIIINHNITIQEESMDESDVHYSHVIVSASSAYELVPGQRVFAPSFPSLPLCGIVRTIDF